CSISSSVRPFVSGTLAKTHIQPSAQKNAKIQKAIDSPTALMSERKNWLTTEAEPQLTAVAMATARPRTFCGKISLITVQTTGPSEKAKQMMKRTREINVT